MYNYCNYTRLPPGKKAKTAPKTSGPTPIKEDVGGASSLDTSTIASRTRSVRKKRLRKSQITGPVELMTSPVSRVDAK